jgi:NAD(P) transhydrogenase subunit beta
MSANQLTLWYLVASVCFILALKGLSHPETARRGNWFGIAGMTIAVLTTIAVIARGRIDLILVAMLAGGMLGAFVARRVQMTQMPELVAAMHSLVGMAAVLIAVAAVNNPSAFGVEDPLPTGNKLELFIGTFVGAITFSGSVIAFGKLAGLGKHFRLFSSAPVVFPGQHWLNLALALVMIGFGAAFFMADDKAWTPFLVMTAIAFVLGLLIIIPIGGADMPVVISMLNSYSGWAAAAMGFTLHNSAMIITGALVGSSGAILSYIMCRAMNRSFISVIAGGFGGDAVAGAGGEVIDRAYKRGSAEDAAFLMSQADQVIIVPGYGMAVSQAQHALREMADLLKEQGVRVKYAIHPVAGRMPGHMNVLLAEANVPYDEVFELEDINSEFAQTDVAFVIGANDVTNPAAKTDKSSPIYGMPVLDVEKARTVLFVKRSMGGVGYAGVDNELFYRDNTMMLLADAKKMVEEIVKNIG